MKNVNPLLILAAEIKKTYFMSNPTTKTLEEVKKEIMNKYEGVPNGELMILLIMVEHEYNKMKEALPA